MKKTAIVEYEHQQIKWIIYMYWFPIQIPIPNPCPDSITTCCLLWQRSDWGEVSI